LAHYVRSEAVRAGLSKDSGLSPGQPSTNKKKEKEDKWPTTQERESWPSSFSLFVSSEDDRGREASVDR